MTIEVNYAVLTDSANVVHTVTTDGNVEAKNTDVTYDPSVLLALHDLNLEVKGRARTLSWWIEK